MSLVTYATASKTANLDDPAHLVIGQEPPLAPAVCLGYRFFPNDLPASHQAPAPWRDYLLNPPTAGYVVDETEYTAHLLRGSGGIYYKSMECSKLLTSIVEPPHNGRRREAKYSFNPDNFHTNDDPCYDCVGRAVFVTSLLVSGFLQTVPRGRLKRILEQLKPMLSWANSSLKLQCGAIRYDVGVADLS